jgi:glycosyltransferase involved in cell wall biosynthesis
MVSLSVIIPTYDPARPLKRCLRSVVSQPLLPGDEVLIVGDTRDGDLPTVEALVKDFGEQFRYIPHDGGRMSFGHDQINHGMTVAMGDYLTFMDDDDVYTEGAFGSIRNAAEEHPGRPLLFRFVTRFHTLVWGALPVLEQDHVGGHCAVFPNKKAYLAPWGPHYQGDWTFVRGTLDKWPGGEVAVVWREEVIALARPNTPEDGG